MGSFPSYNFECNDINNNNNTLHNDTNITNISNNNSAKIDCRTFIGYSNTNYIYVLFIIIATIGLIANIILIRDFFSKQNNENSRKQSSMKKLFATLPILDGITSIYWLISAGAFYNSLKIKNNQGGCYALSVIYFLVYTFEFIFINFILIHFRKISINPIEGILKPGKNLKRYFAISITLAIGILIFVICFGIIGRSPMNTCFINTEKGGRFALIFLIPCISICLVIYQVIYDLTCRELFVNDKQVREAYKNNSMYILVFSLLHVPMFLLILITSGIGKVIQNEKGLPGYAFFTTLLTCSIPMIVGIIRNCRGFTKIKAVKQLSRRIRKSFSRKFNTKDDPNGLKEQINSVNNTVEDQFDWLEQHSMEFFMRDILLSVAHCIHESKSYDINISLINFEEENEASIKHTINLNTFKLDDPTVTESQFIDVKIIDYAPKIFAYLRNLENIDIDQMAESFLPKNNKRGISESQGKSGSFFISTDDNQYMIKTLKVDEFDLIRKTFLNEYEKYIKKNPNSLLCRIYGMYNIILSQGEEILIIVMRNVIGEFKDNIIAKYDLKGSTKNRISEFDMEKSDEKTMKDLNFNEYERGIFMSKDNISTFRSLIKYDALFLRRMELMDYSLFLVKLTLSKEQIDDLFGDEFQKIQEKEFNELMEETSMTSNNVIGNTYTFNEKRFNYGDIHVQERKIFIKENGTQFPHSKYYKQHIYPSLVPGNAYILAIIDYFQIFNFYKYVESTIKKIGTNDDSNSCVEPRTYAKRFINYFNILTDFKYMLKDGQKSDSSNFKNIEDIIDEKDIEDEEAILNFINDTKSKKDIELKNIG